MNTGQQVKVLRVIDGDTVEVALKKGLFGKTQSQRIRLYGIDAPESAQRGGQAATKQLQRMIGRRRRIWMDSAGSDQYNRTVAIIYPDKSKPTNSYNIRMLETGHARAYMTRGAHRGPYQRAELQAKEANLGIWKHNSAQAPWEWRQRQRARQSAKSQMGVHHAGHRSRRGYCPHSKPRLHPHKLNGMQHPPHLTPQSRTSRYPERTPCLN